MSRCTWAVYGNEIDEEKIKELCLLQYKAFMDFIKRMEITIEEYAKYIQYEDTSELEDGDYASDIKIEVVAQILDKKFERLQDALFEKTKIKLWLVYPGGDIETGEDRVYWTIENTYVVNEEIDKSFLKDSYFEVIAGG